VIWRDDSNAVVSPPPADPHCVDQPVNPLVPPLPAGPFSSGER